MLSADRDAVICDLAETYGVLDWRALPVRLLATLASGLRDESRIRMILAEKHVSDQDTLLAAAVDRLSLLVWMQTRDGQEGRNRPASLLDAMMGTVPDDGDVLLFESADDFERERARILGVSTDGI